VELNTVAVAKTGYHWRFGSDADRELYAELTEQAAGAGLSVNDFVRGMIATSTENSGFGDRLREKITEKATEYRVAQARRRLVA
jgi:hypothetical protein